MRATVTVGDMETGYLRAGSGPALLLVLPASQTIGSSTTGGGTFDRLVDALSPHCRVFVPDADSALPFATWLRGFMDGLGLDSASLLTDDGVGADALDFARTHPERVERIVIVRIEDRPRLDGDDRSAVQRNPLPPAASVVPPLIIVSLDGDDAETIDAGHPLVRFLTMAAMD